MGARPVTSRWSWSFWANISRTRTAFTAENYAELRRIKAAHDPDNFFRTGHAIPPSVTSAAA